MLYYTTLNQAYFKYSSDHASKAHLDPMQRLLRLNDPVLRIELLGHRCGLLHYKCPEKGSHHSGTVTIRSRALNELGNGFESGVTRSGFGTYGPV